MAWYKNRTMYLSAIFGVWVGILFLFTGLVVEMQKQSLPFSYWSYLYLHRTHYVYYLLDIAPFGFGILFGLLGFQRSLFLMNSELEETVSHRARELAKANIELERERERYRTVADFNYNMEYWIAPDGHIIYISPSCERVTGYNQDDFINDPDLLQKIVHPNDVIAHEQHIRNMNNLGPESLDFRIIRKDGLGTFASQFSARMEACSDVVSPMLISRSASRRMNNCVSYRVLWSKVVPRLSLQIWLVILNTQIKNSQRLPGIPLKRPLGIILEF
jgi:PAS domain S-box-containing protein